MKSWPARAVNLLQQKYCALSKTAATQVFFLGCDPFNLWHDYVIRLTERTVHALLVWHRTEAWWIIMDGHPNCTKPNLQGTSFGEIWPTTIKGLGPSCRQRQIKTKLEAVEINTLLLCHTYSSQLFLFSSNKSDENTNRQSLTTNHHPTNHCNGRTTKSTPQ